MFSGGWLPTFAMEGLSGLEYDGSRRQCRIGSEVGVWIPPVLFISIVSVGPLGLVKTRFWITDSRLSIVMAELAAKLLMEYFGADFLFS
jgi:hypothetical protein